MERDIRKTELYGEIEEHYRKALEPAFGKISGAANPVASPDGRTVAFAGSRLEKLEGVPSSRICTVDVETASLEEITSGANSDRLPRWSPNGSRLAFLSDRTEKDRFQLCLLESGRLGEALSTPTVEGTAEYLAWSPNGRSILLGIAGRGADLAGIQGSGTTKDAKEELPGWMPTLDQGPTEQDYRRAYVYDLASRSSRAVSREGLNVWESVWAGPDCLLAIVSDEPTEDAWYSASLALIDLDSGKEQVIYRSDQWQLGLPAASPSGNRLAVVEALCSDRAVVAGNVLLIDPTTGEAKGIDTGAVDVTQLEWRDEDRLLFSGVRGLDCVVGECDAATGEVRELWTHAGFSGGRFYPEVSPVGESGFVTVTDRYDQYPEVTLVRDGEARHLTSLAHPGAEYVASLGGRMETVTWKATDGREIEGLLLLPEGQGPHPLIVNVHGGPVGAVRDRWIGPGFTRWLVGKGYAFFYPNPRGSSGRGQEFAGMVYGDMGGADMDDVLSGIDMLVERGIADPKRLGVTGGSYGGFMSSWLITQTDRFAAAAPMHPVTDWYSQHNTSNIGLFDQLFLRGEMSESGNQYFQRSPVVFAHQVKTPALNVAGEIDRCTPPTQAKEFHEALVKNGVESILVTYPGEGHGVRKLPALIDLSTRFVDWFQRHMPV